MTHVSFATNLKLQAEPGCMGNEYSRITKTDTEQYSTYSSRVISRPTVLSNTKIILLGSKKQPCTILDTPEEKITQVSLHRDGSIFYSSISHNVYVTSTTEHDLLPYIPKEGTFVTKVASSYSKTVFLFNTGQASFFNLETRTIQPVQIKHRRFKFQDVAIGDIYVYLVQQGGKEVYRIRTSETCDSLHFKKIAKHAGKIAKIGGGEKHMSVLTTRGHAFFAGCTSICLHTNMHSCENRLVPDKFFHRNKRTFLDMAVAKNYSFFIPSHERDVVYCVYHEHLSYTTLRGVSSIFASGNRFFYQTSMTLFYADNGR